MPREQASIGLNRTDLYFVAHKSREDVWLVPYCRFHWQTPVPEKSCRSKFIEDLIAAEKSGSPERLAQVLEEGGKNKWITIEWQKLGGIAPHKGITLPVAQPTRWSLEKVDFCDPKHLPMPFVKEDVNGEDT